MSSVTSVVSGTIRHSIRHRESLACSFPVIILEVSKVQLLSQFVGSSADSTGEEPF